MKKEQIYLVLLFGFILWLSYYLISRYSNLKSVRKVFEKMNLKYFKYEEFDSRAVSGVDNPNDIYTRNGKQYLKESGIENMNNVFLLKLEKARDIIEKEWNQTRPNNEKIVFIINSGYRTQQRQDFLKNSGYPTAENSAHLIGRAVDISTVGYNMEQIKFIVKALRRAGFSRFGLATNYIHVDDNPNVTQNTYWVYSSSAPNFNPFDLEI